MHSLRDQHHPIRRADPFTPLFHYRCTMYLTSPIRTRASGYAQSVGAAYQLKPAPTPPEVWPLAEDTPIEMLALLLENTCWKPIDAALRLP